MKTAELTESNVLAVWMGSIADFGELDAYIWEHFQRDFGIELGERTAPEVDAQEQLTPVRELLERFSFSHQWIEDAVGLCQQAGWTNANCAIVLFNVRYKPNLSRSAAGCPIHFVGNVEWAAE